MRGCIAVSESDVKEPYVESTAPTAILDVQDLQNDLEQAAARSTRGRWRLEARAIGSGLALMVVGLVVSALLQGAGFAQHLVGLVALVSGAIMVFLAVTPRRPLLVKLTCGVLIALNVGGVALTALRVAQWTAKACVRVTPAVEGGPEPLDLCETERIIVLVHESIILLVGLASGVRAAQVLVARTTPSRRLDVVWQTVSLELSAVGVLGVSSQVASHAWLGDPLHYEPFLAPLFLCTLGVLCGQPRLRASAQAFIEGRSKQVGKAAVLSAVMGSKAPAEAIREAKRTFRHVATFLPPTVFTADLVFPFGSDVVRPAHLGGVDAFISNSWHDPALEKWLALSQWCDTFREQHKREPRIWLDRLCIQQDSIETSLRSLPIYLAGCHKLVMLRGPTFLTRLWCVMELYVFLCMDGGDTSRVEVINLPSARHADVSSFDARRADCADHMDRTLLLSMIEAHPGGIEAFNEEVRRMLAATVGAADRVRAVQPATVIAPRPSHVSLFPLSGERP